MGTVIHAGIRDIDEAAQARSFTAGASAMNINTQIYLDFMQSQLLLLQEWWLALTPEQQILYIAGVSFGFAFAEVILFVTKNLVVWGLRRFGLSSPNLYGWFPRLIAWRFFLRLWLGISHWWEMLFRFGKVSTGGFASVFNTLSHLNIKNSFLMGTVWFYGLRIYQPIGVKLTKHATIIAGTGSGKSSSVSVSIAHWNGSVFMLDPTGVIENAIRKFDKRQWVVFEPYSDTTAQLNPFDNIKAAMKREGEDIAVKWAYRLGESFISTPKDSKQPYFTEASRGMFVGLILHVLTTFPEETHNLGTVRDLIVHGYRVYDEDGSLESSPEEARAVLYKLMRDNPAFGGAVAGASSSFINAGDETRANLESTLQSCTKVLDIPSVRHFFAKTTLPLSALKTRSDVVFSLNVPLYSLREELKDLARLIQNLVCYTFESVKQRKGTCLFVCDEVQAQGYNACLEISLPVSRSQGLYVVVISQDLEGLKAAYPKTFGNFIGAADVVMWMGTAHQHNLAMLNQILGKKTLIQKDKRTGATQHREVDVMTPEQIGRFLNPDKGNMIVTRAGKRAMRLKIDPYFKALPIWRYSPDPDHKEPLLRRIMRLVLSPILYFKSQQPKERQHD